MAENTEDDDSDRRRKRGLLKKYYGSGGGGTNGGGGGVGDGGGDTNGGVVKDPLNMNEAYFQHETYLNKMFKEKKLQVMTSIQLRNIRKYTALSCCGVGLFQQKTPTER